MGLLPLVEMGTAPPSIPGFDMLRPVILFSHRHVYSDNCSCLIEQHSRTMAVTRLSCACERTDCFQNAAFRKRFIRESNSNEHNDSLISVICLKAGSITQACRTADSQHFTSPTTALIWFYHTSFP